MQEDLTLHITKHLNGAKLTFRFESQKLVRFCFDETVSSIIDQAKLGYMDFVFPHSTGGKTSSTFKKNGLSRQ